MRSMKLLAATAVLAALVAGPVMAQDAGGTMSPTTSTESGKTTVKHHSTKKPKRHKKTTGTSSTGTGSTTEGTTTTK